MWQTRRVLTAHLGQGPGPIQQRPMLGNGGLLERQAGRDTADRRTALSTD